MSLVSCWLFFAQLVDFVGNIDRAFRLHIAQLFNFGFEFGNRLLKIQKGLFSQVVSPRGPCSAKGRDKGQYATGSGASERQIYQVATLHQGFQASATSRASLRLTGSPEK